MEVLTVSYFKFYFDTTLPPVLNHNPMHFGTFPEVSESILLKKPHKKMELQDIWTVKRPLH